MRGWGSRVSLLFHIPEKYGRRVSLRQVRGASVRSGFECTRDAARKNVIIRGRIHPLFFLVSGD